MNEEGLALNIGCGEKLFSNIDGYRCINVDIRPLKGVDIICDVRTLPYQDECFDRILASDIVEHFPISEIDALLAEWSRVLKVKGIIKFRTPNLKWMVKEYLKGGAAKFVSYHIFGGQEYPTNFHYVIFDRDWLKSLCAKVNLIEIGYKELGSNFELMLIKE